MIMYSRELTVAWGESDPFGLVYYPMMFTWFNETEHELLRALGFPTNKLIKEHRTAFVMGDVHFRFVGPAAYGDKVRTTIMLNKIGSSTLHWDCKAVQASSGDVITEAGQQKLRAIGDFEDRINDAREAGRKSLLLLVRRAGEPRFVALSLEESGESGESNE